VEIGAVYNGFCKPQSCQKQKNNYSTGSTSTLTIISAQISKKVDGIGIDILLFKGNTSRPLIVPGTTIGSGGEIPPTPPGNLSTDYNNFYIAYPPKLSCLKNASASQALTSAFPVRISANEGTCIILVNDKFYRNLLYAHLS